MAGKFYNSLNFFKGQEKASEPEPPKRGSSLFKFWGNESTDIESQKPKEKEKGYFSGLKGKISSA